jgi:cytochrome c oxidase assembly factor CtaG
MFAGMPGTGIGALFFALVCLVLAVRKRMRGCSKIAAASSVWILGCLVLVYGSGASVAVEGEMQLFRFSLMPVLLLIGVLMLSTTAAWFVRRGGLRGGKGD